MKVKSILFGLLSSQYCHTFAKIRDETFAYYLLPESLVFTHVENFMPCFLSF